MLRSFDQVYHFVMSQRSHSFLARHPDADMTLRWVPGHMEIQGNELADREAKRAAAGASGPLNKQADVPR